MSRAQERVIEDKVKDAAHTELGKMFHRLISLRYERYKEALVGTDQDLTRGRAQEARDLQRLFAQDDLTNND